MAREFKLPELGEGTHEAEISEVLVSPGDHVEEDEAIFVVETDKASMEIPSPFEGTVESIAVEAGEMVKVGTVLITYSDGDETSAENSTEKKAKEKPEPEVSEASKAESPDEKKTKEKTSEPPKAAQESKDKDQKERKSKRPVPASPATRRLARELDVDLSQVPPSGPEGRVTHQDVKAFAEDREKSEKAEEVQEPQAVRGHKEKDLPPLSPISITLPELPNFESWGDIERSPLRSIRRTIAQRMSISWSQIPHVTHRDEADVTDLEKIRREFKENITDKGGSLSLMVFVMKAVVSVLREYPRFNASLDVRNEEIILKNYYNIGIAVDTDQGLIVPNIQNVERKTVTDLAIELNEMVDRVRKGEGTVDEMRGGTFTITNVGILGGTDFSPIINYPEVAILGMARAKWEPEIAMNADDQQPKIKAKYKLPLILGFDHRVIDGADAARFVNRLIEILEDPEKLLLHM